MGRVSYHVRQRVVCLRSGAPAQGWGFFLIATAADPYCVTADSTQRGPLNVRVAFVDRDLRCLVAAPVRYMTLLLRALPRTLQHSHPRKSPLNWRPQSTQTTVVYA